MTTDVEPDEDVPREVAEVGNLVTLLRSVAILGMAYPQQVEHLDVVVPDDDPEELVEALALDFDDGFEFLDQFVELGWVNDSAADHVRLVDGMLSAMSGTGNERLWTREALAESPLWEDIRRTARSALLFL